VAESDEYTAADELIARAKIHARETIDASGIDVDMDALEWAVSKRAKRRAGACRWDRDRAVATIVLATRAYETLEWEAFAGVVRHELVHAWEFQQFGTSGHGKRFHEQAARLDAPRHCQSFSSPRYRLRCTNDDCSWEAGRHRASRPVTTPAAYRCGECGTGLIAEHVSSGRTWERTRGFERAKAALAEEW